MKRYILLLASLSLLSALTSCGHDNRSTSESVSVPKPAATTAVTTSTQEVTTVKTSGTEATTETETEESTEPGREASEDELIYLATRYYGSRNNHIPEFVDVLPQEDGTAAIHLYDIYDGHASTCDWYYIDPSTCKGTDILSRDVDLNFKEADMWAPEVEQRSELSESGAFCGIAYIGYMPEMMEYSQDNVALRETFIQSGAIDKFSFIPDITEKYFAGTWHGTELYLVIPRDPDAHVVVTQYDMETDSETGRIYSSYNGSPFLLRCNYSDISSDVRITITDNEGEHQTFSPYISLRDGEPTTDCSDVKIFKLEPPVMD